MGASGGAGVPQYTQQGCPSKLSRSATARLTAIVIARAFVSFLISLHQTAITEKQGDQSAYPTGKSYPSEQDSLLPFGTACHSRAPCGHLA